MANVLVIREGKKYLTSTLLDYIRKYGHDITEMEPDMKVLSSYTDTPDICMIIVESTMSEKSAALVYLRDLAIEKDIPIFLLGYPIDIEGIRNIITASAIEEEILRPFDVKEIAAHIDDYLSQLQNMEKKKILVVDDSGVMLRNVKNLLGEKYQVILANSGAMAVKYLSLDKPDLVLLDYEMPVINGKQVLEIVRTEQDFAGVPVIFLTGKNDRNTIMDVMGLKPDGYLLKSMSSEAFVQAIEEFFEKRRIMGA
jgi:CheY-like chemotaxis protein